MQSCFVLWYTIRCPHYGVHNTVSTIPCTQYGVYNSVATIPCPQYASHNTVSTIPSPQYPIHNTVSTIPCTQYRVHNTVSTIPCPQYRIHNTIFTAPLHTRNSHQADRDVITRSWRKCLQTASDLRLASPRYGRSQIPADEKGWWGYPRIERVTGGPSNGTQGLNCVPPSATAYPSS